MSRRVVVTGFAAAALTLASCSQYAPGASPKVQPTSAPELPIQTKAANQPIIVAIAAVGSSAAWAVTDKALFMTSNGGSDWSPDASADISGVRSLVAPDQQHLVLGAIAGQDGLQALVRQSSDGGGHWRELPLAANGQPGDVRLAAGSGVIAALVVQTTSANASIADLFISTGASSFAKRPAPAAGALSVTGPDELWLAGGVLGNQLWRSTDDGKGWTEIGLPTELGPEIGVGAPQRINGTLVLPVTINRSSTKEALLTSTDGAAWRLSSTITVGGDTGMGTVLPAALASDRLIVAGPIGGLFAATATGMTLDPVSPNGLPPNVTSLSFAIPSDGWAVVTDRGCASGKSNCYAYTRLFFTSDAGQTWTEEIVPG